MFKKKEASKINKDPAKQKGEVKKKSERILTFDILRGYFLFVILLNHLYYYPSGLELLTGRSALYASTAEGFFVISGIMLGLVRGRKLINKPFSVSAKLVLKRSLQLYATSVILTLLFTVIGYMFLDNPGLKTTIFANPSDWWSLVVNTLTLQYTYGWADFLRLYAIFIFFAPVAIWLLRKGWWYVLLAISITVWALYPLIPAGSSFAQPASWQLIFFGGFIIGFYWEDILNKWRSLTIKTRKAIGLALTGLFVATLVASFTLVFGHYLGGTAGPAIDSAHHVVEQYFSKGRLPVSRLLLGTIWLWGMIYLARRFESTIKKYLGWFLLEWGMNSLYVYTISAFVLFFIHLIIPANSFWKIEQLPINLGLSILVVAIVHLILKKRILANIIPR